jgi:hypothetical protein
MRREATKGSVELPVDGLEGQALEGEDSERMAPMDGMGSESLLDRQIARDRRHTNGLYIICKVRINDKVRSVERM